MNVRTAVRRTAIALVAATSLVASASAQEGEKVDLRLKVKAGDVFYFRQTQHMDQVVHMSEEMTINTTLDLTQVSTYSIESVKDDGAAEVKVTIGDIKGKMENPMFGTIDVDTTKDAKDAGDNPMAAMIVKPMTALANKTFTLTLDRRGAVTSIKGIKEIMEEAFKDLPIPPEMREKMGGAFDDEGMKSQMQGQFMRFADGPIAIGTSWNVESTMKQPVEVHVRTEYKLESADADKAVISTKGVVGVGAKKDEKDNVTGSITVARADGMMLQSETNMHMVIEMGGGGDMPKINSEQTMKVKVDRVTAAEAARPAKKEPPPTAPAPPVGNPPAPPK